MLLAVAAVTVQMARARQSRRPSPQLEVAELAAHPADHLGTVVVAGVVGKVDATTSLVLLADRSGCTSCSSGCTTEGTQVPVRWTGKLPKVGDQLLVKGELFQQPDGFVLAGSSVGPAPPVAAEKAKGAQR